MNLHKCILYNNRCYTSGRTIVPKGVMVHSTGANNPNLRRYVQPSASDPNYQNLMNLLGTNNNNNSWNSSSLSVCVHGFIGKLADGSIATMQTLPWNRRGWHAGTGTSGQSANNTHISFEICEDALSNKDYFDKVYKEAVELTAYLCEEYNLDPLADGVVICHSEGYDRGIASNHSDVMHWFPRFGKTMDDFRQDVNNIVNGDENMTQEKFNQMMNVYLDQLATEAPSPWSAEERDWAESVGLIKGNQEGTKMYKSFTTREQMVIFLYRLYNMLNG